MKRSSLKAKKGLSKSSSFNRKPSKKTEKWLEVRAQTLSYLNSVGITSCELVYEDCTRDRFLTLAHSKKRRFIKDDSELAQVILACSSCHYKIEYLPKEDMYSIVVSTINKRKTDGKL